MRKSRRPDEAGLQISEVVFTLELNQELLECSEQKQNVV